MSHHAAWCRARLAFAKAPRHSPLRLWFLYKASAHASLRMPGAVPDPVREEHRRAALRGMVIALRKYRAVRP